jgi:deoxyribose-phosphate aldolase
MPPPASETFARAVDHTLLDPAAGAAAIDALCDEAGAHGFAAVCVYPWWVARCTARLLHSDAAVATVISFPHGLDETRSKVEAGRAAIASGADELDVVLPWGPVRDGDEAGALADMEAFVKACRLERPDVVVKIILEAAELDPPSLEAACRVVAASGADFAKTSTGMRGGARVDDVVAMRGHLPAAVRIKASGGIRDAATAAAMLDAGAERLGTSSAIAILEELERHAVA